MTSTRNRFQAFAAMALLAWLAAAHAARPVWDQEGPVRDDGEEETPWTEQRAALPAYPDGKHFVAVPSQEPGSGLEMFVDEPSLAIGADGVVRYVLMLRSARGTENLFYEGIRCVTREWRSYAYGTSTGKWQVLGEQPWRLIQGQGYDRYREQLFRYYLCNSEMGPLRREEMFRRMRYGAPRNPE